MNFINQYSQNYLKISWAEGIPGRKIFKKPWGRGYVLWRKSLLGKSHGGGSLLGQSRPEMFVEVTPGTPRERERPGPGAV